MISDKHFDISALILSCNSGCCNEAASRENGCSGQQGIFFNKPVIIEYRHYSGEDEMYYVRVEAEFAAAHRLVHYHGKCERFHGHNYRVRVWAAGKGLGEGGMLVDFGVVKAALRDLIDESLDHRDLNELPEFEDDPSAERIAKFIYARLCAALPGVPLSAVDVFETGTSMARYLPDSPAES
jgi:6-pyruvoyltetrahydropterin/6-carboxytetrahydropterin synthase